MNSSAARSTRAARPARAAWRARLAGVSAAAILALGACGGEQAAVQVDPRSAPRSGMQDGFAQAPPPSYSGAPSGGYGGRYAPQGSGETARRGNTPEGSAFANWVLAQDPQHKYILDAYVRDDQHLGIIIRPNVMSKAQVQQMMTAMLNAMQQTFPGRPLEVIAYYVSGDELGRTTWDPRTRRANTVWRQ